MHEASNTNTKKKRETFQRLLKESHTVAKRFLNGEAAPDEKVLVYYNNSPLAMEFNISDLEIIAKIIFDSSNEYLVRIIHNNGIKLYNTNSATKTFDCFIVAEQDYAGNYILRLIDYIDITQEKERKCWNFRPYKLLKLLSEIDNK